MSATSVVPSNNAGLSATNEMVQTDTLGADIVFHAAFTTHTIPDISPDAGIVGLCAVPKERAGRNDLGWHIANFLAFKALFCGETHPRAQTWLSQCDIARIVEASPDDYAHGKDGRLVDGAAQPSTYLDQEGKTCYRKDEIKVVQNGQDLMAEFTSALTAKHQVAKAKGVPLVIIACGLTNAEQDIYFGKVDATYRITTEKLRQLLGPDADVILITPAMFSAGWTINPFLCRSPVGHVQGDDLDFLARQVGGAFALKISTHFLGWKCPLLDYERLSPADRVGIYPGPEIPTKKQHEHFKALKQKIHSVIIGGLSPIHGDHSFYFDAENDDWEQLVGPRKYKPLSHYEKKWSGLKTRTGAAINEGIFHFLGNAFGGNAKSQANHIKHLIQEAFESCPGAWRGYGVRDTYKKLLEKANPSEMELHEVFNAMEHRTALTVLADLTVEYLDFQQPSQVRCRDWDEHAWKKELAKAELKEECDIYGTIVDLFPHVNLPPENRRNRFSIIQRRLETPAQYLAAALHLSQPDTILDAKQLMSNFYHAITAHQTKLVLRDEELNKLCAVWLEAVHMPVRVPGSEPRSIDSVQGPSTAPSTGNVSELDETETRTEFSENVAQPYSTTATVGSSTGAKGKSKLSQVSYIDSPIAGKTDVSPMTPKVQAGANDAIPTDHLDPEYMERLRTANPHTMRDVLDKEKDALLDEIFQADNRIAECKQRLRANQQALNYMLKTNENVAKVQTHASTISSGWGSPHDGPSEAQKGDHEKAGEEVNGDKADKGKGVARQDLEITGEQTDGEQTADEQTNDEQPIIQELVIPEPAIPEPTNNDDELGSGEPSPISGPLPDRTFTASPPGGAGLSRGARAGTKLYIPPHLR